LKLYIKLFLNFSLAKVFNGGLNFVL